MGYIRRIHLYDFKHCVPLDWQEVLKGHSQQGGLEYLPSWVGMSFYINE